MQKANSLLNKAMMPGFLAFSVASFAVLWRIGAPSEAPGPHQKCRYLPGDPEWPTVDKWAEFNNTKVEGTLIKTVPIGSPCHRDQPFLAFDQAECDRIQQGWNVPETHVASSSSIMASFFTNDSCNAFLGPDSQCIIGSYSVYAVRAKTVNHIQETLKFAQKQNIRLTIRNSGHDYYGRSTGAGALTIWTQELKSTKLLDYNKHGYTGKAVQLGAAVSVSEASQFATGNGLIVLGGSCPTVGIAGGYIQGGGTSLVASRFGLAADNVLEYEVVTADGAVKTATPSNEHNELYYALSGGGGGTYAVVTSVTVKAFPGKVTSAATLDFSSDGLTPETFYGIVKVFMDGSHKYAEAKMASTFLLMSTGFSLAPMMGFDVPQKKLDEILQPVRDALRAKRIPFDYTSKEYATLQDAYTATNPFTPVDLFNVGGRIIPEKVSFEALVDAFRQINEKGGIVSGYNLDVSSSDRNILKRNAAHPAWRSAVMSVVVGLLYNQTNPRANVESQKLMTNSFIPLLDAATSPSPPASFPNEADFNDPHWQQALYGDKYQKLRQIKKKYDRRDLFYGRTSVGSETWEQQSDGRLCRARSP